MATDAISEKIAAWRVKKATRDVRANRIGKKLAARYERARFQDTDQNGDRVSRKKPLQRKERRGNPRPRPIIAYDLETTRIKRGTPKPLYITAHGADFQLSSRVKSIEHLAQLLTIHFLVPEFHRCRFVAWNGNNFDVFFIAAALLQLEGFVIRPYLTRSKNLRGLRVSTIPKEGEPELTWEFLDGIAMTMGIPFTLKKFLEVFAPEFGKLAGPDFEREEFDYRNADHVRYAERDSEGLYHAIMAAQEIVIEHFRIPLQPTIGNLGIKTFMAHMPEGIQVWEPPLAAVKAIRDTVLRGGFCYCMRKYQGPVWKYDINQAYAAAMRETWLPAGRCFRIFERSKFAKCAIYRVTGKNLHNKIPFYHRALATGQSVFGVESLAETWITSQELKQLESEGWSIEIHEGFAWEEAFRMTEYVDKLESLRRFGSGGPKGAQGTMIKCIGNNSYGKTVEKLDGIELVLSNNCPNGFAPYQGPDEIFEHIWFRFNEPLSREYHQPQIGAFITAHVRMVVRRAALLVPNNWLYADTDCVIFDAPVTGLAIDVSEYGKWKVEAEGKPYRIIGKKVYADFGAQEKHCKGLNVKRLTDADFAAWFDGTPPIQTQVHRQNFLKTMRGADMFVERVRTGERKPVENRT